MPARTVSTVFSRNMLPEIDFVINYENELEAISNKIRSINPDYILPLTRKGPRILELMKLKKIYQEDTPVISERTLEYMTHESLENKSIVILDDIIISGSTIKDLIERLEEYRIKHISVLSIAIEEESISRIDIEKLCPLEEVRRLKKSERSIFCKKIVDAFTILNKPYDMDYCLFYTNFRSDYISTIFSSLGLDKAYNTTTVLQHNRGFRRYSIILDDPIWVEFFNFTFKDSISTPELLKIRLYYNELTGDVTLAPMVVFSATKDRFKDEIFSEDLSFYNELINFVRQKYVYSKHEEFAIFKLVWWLESYFFGLAFNVLKSNEKRKILSFSYPSQVLYFDDLSYIFGPELSDIIIHFLDLHYNETIVAIKDLLVELTNACVNRKEYFNPKKDTESSFDEKRSEIYKKIKHKVNENIVKQDSLFNQVATIFEEMTYEIEIPWQQKMKRLGINKEDSERLKIGFNYRQIKEILINESIIDAGNHDDSISLSLGLDFLVDAGVIIPIFYLRDDEVFERAYRYGESGLSAKRFGYIFASVYKEMFRYLEKNDRLEPRIKKISFEKMGIILENLIINSEKVDFAYDGEEGDRSLNIPLKPVFRRYGKVLMINDSGYASHKNGKLFTYWCINEKIMEPCQDSGKYIKYSGGWFDNNLRGGNEELLKIVGYNDIVTFSTISRLLYFIDTSIDMSGKSKILIAITTCSSSKDYLEAAKELLRNFFEDTVYSLPLGLIISWSKKYESISEDELNAAYYQTRRALGAANDVLVKNKLRINLPQYLDLIENYFYECEDEELRSNYYTTLYNHLNKIKTEINPLNEDPNITGLRNDLLVFSSLCVYLSSILESLLYLNRAVSGLLGKTHEKRRAAIYSGFKKIYNSIDDWNSFIKSNSDINYWGIYVKNFPIISLNQKPTIIDNVICARIMKEVIPQINNGYILLSKVYAHYNRTWDYLMEDLFPSKNRTISENANIDGYDIVTFEGAIWYDIKDSSGKKNKGNKESAVRFIRSLNLYLQEIRSDLKDGYFNSMDENDEKAIFIKDKNNVAKYLCAIMKSAIRHRLFMRIGVSCWADTHKPVHQHEMGESFKNNDNFILLKRLGAYLQDNHLEEEINEDTKFFSVIISKGALSELWDNVYPSELQSQFKLVDTINDRYISVPSVGNKIQFEATKWESIQSQLSDYQKKC